MFESHASPPRSETTIGRYRLLGLIGHGGMADVHLALSTGLGSVRKLVAVKRLRPEHRDDPEFAAMFLDEARLAARVSHPNVVQAYEVGEEDGLPFIAMEYLDGQPLHRVLQRLGSRVGLSTRLRLLCELLAGLHHAHELRDYDGRPLQVVHRDVNPQNVFVTYDGHVKLVDFGIAKALDSVVQTRMGMFKGKLAYMAPEQVRGEDVDRRADVFAVGVMLAECVTGRRLWNGRPELEIANLLAAGEIPCPTPPEVRPELAAVVARALAPDPGDRHPSAEALRLAIVEAIAAIGAPPDDLEIAAAMVEAFAEQRTQTAALIERGVGVAPSSSTFNAVTEDFAAPEELTRRTPPPTPDHERSQDIERSVSASFVAAPPRGQAWAGRLTTAALVGATAIAATLWISRAPDQAAPAVTTLSALGNLPGAAASQPMVRLSGDIDTDATLRRGTTYLLEFDTYVAAGVTLTIEPGTTILGDPRTRGTLIVLPGGRLIADGTRERPIVFTSARAPAERAPGDWGGVLLLGRAPINLRDQEGRSVHGQVEGLTELARYGGDRPDDDSGVLRWVRIEYSGTTIGPNNEINGLTLAGVGRGTVIDHVAVEHTADDCFEFFGGNVDARYLVCQDPGDDAFDWDLGYHGRLQFLVAFAMPSEGRSNGFEGDNDPKGSDAKPRSAPVIYNASLCGPTAGGPGERYGVLVRHGSLASIHDALVLGFDAGVDVRGANTRLTLDHARFGGQRAGAHAYREHAEGDAPELDDDDEGFDELSAFTAITTERGLAPDCSRVESLLPAAGSTTEAVAPPDDGFFDSSAVFVGALRDAEDDWLDAGWLGW
ncbi:MAG: serine/threonine protein kinase [Deltaproteobacteria bacterium]|nr:serine/threonine protein kinase [Nannocystaceae bacterium]